MRIRARRRNVAAVALVAVLFGTAATVTAILQHEDEQTCAQLEQQGYLDRCH